MGPAPWRSARPATEDIGTLEKIKTCNTGDQHLGKAQDLQQRGDQHNLQQRDPASWRSARPAKEGISTLEKLRTYIRGYHHPRKTQYMQQRGQHLCRSQNFLLTRALLNLLRKGLGRSKPATLPCPICIRIASNIDARDHTILDELFLDDVKSYNTKYEFVTLQEYVIP
jgi:hypothetical protein